MLRQKKVTKKKASHVRAASRCLALLAAFGTLANSLRSNSASVLIRTLLRCSARPNGGLGYLSARPLRELRPNGLFAALTSRSAGVASFLTPHCSQGHGTPCPYGLTHRATTRVAPTPSLLTKARHAVPLRLTPQCNHKGSLLSPHSSLLTPHSSLLTPLASLHPVIPGLPRNLPSSCCLYFAPCTSWRTGTARRAPTASPTGQPQGLPLRPHSSQRHGTPCPYGLTPHSNHTPPYDLTPHSYDLTPHSSLLTPTTSLLTPTTSLLQKAPFFRLGYASRS